MCFYSLDEILRISVLSSVFFFFLCLLQADLSSDTEEGSGAFYGVSSQYSGTENITISVSTKVCSFGKQVVEKVEVRKWTQYFDANDLCFISEHVLILMPFCGSFPHTDRICTYGRREVCVPYPSFTHVWIYDQLHPQTQTPAREIHDEQCTGELHHPTGKCKKR